MEIKTGSWWIDDKSGLEVLVKSIVGESFKESTVCYDVLYSSGERLHSDKCSYKEFLYRNSPKTFSTEYAVEKIFKKGKDFNNDYRVGYNDGWHDCEASFELGNEFTDSIQEQAYDEGYDQAIDDLIEAGVIGEEEYLDEDFEDDYSEYEFGDVEDDEEEYCFYKELARVLNGEFTSNINFNGNKKEELDEYNGGYGEAKVDGTDGSERKHSHYFKDVRHLDYIDIYELNKLFPIDDDTDCILHARKKLLVCGGRGGSKDMITDITDARDTLNRYLQIEGVEE